MRIKNIYHKFLLKKYVIELLKKKDININILDVWILEKGFKCKLDLNFLYSYSDIKEQEEFLKDNIKAEMVDIYRFENYVYISVYMDEISDIIHVKKELEKGKILIGHNYEGDIILDMNVTPHLLICGLSGQGKTQMVKTIVNNLNLKDVILINCFKHDFEGFKGEMVNGNVKILERLKSLSEGEIKGKYVILDELLMLCKDKEISRAITELLAVGRHKEIYLISISQIGNKESLKFKDLFNARVCFRCVEESTYRTILGSSVGNDLKKREFYCLSSQLIKGRTFTNL